MRPKLFLTMACNAYFNHCKTVDLGPSRITILTFEPKALTNLYPKQSVLLPVEIMVYPNQRTIVVFLSKFQNLLILLST